jgi:hypothetical protein
MTINCFKKILSVVIILLLTQISFAKDEEKNKETDEDSLTRCFKAWGTHPFTKDSDFKTISTSVKVFGIGENPGDDEKTESPRLVLINPSVNVMGGTIYELSNPNGWYCFKANVNVMGGLVIKAQCKAHLAFASSGTTVMGSSDSKGKGVTVMGKTKIEHVGCE